MKYFRLKADVEKHPWLTSDYENVIDNLKSGKTYSQNWKAIKLYQSIEDGEEEKKLSDLMHLTTDLKVVSEKAKLIIEQNSKNKLEFLPVKINSNDNLYYILNVFKIIDCLDYMKSRINYFKDSKKIKYIDKFTFHEKELENVSCFRVKNYESIIVVDENLKNIIDKSMLSGVIFEDLSEENTMAQKLQSILKKSRNRKQ